MVTHPSGRPIRERVIKAYPRPQGTTKGFWNARLNEEPVVELAGGAGFYVNLSTDDPLYHELKAKRRNG